VGLALADAGAANADSIVQKSDDRRFVKSEMLIA